MFEQTDLSVMFEKKICDFPCSVLVYATALEGMLRILYMIHYAHCHIVQSSYVFGMNYTGTDTVGPSDHVFS